VQILDPWRIAQRVGVPVVSDFRRADLAAGGQGAPLAPWPHALLFGPRLPAGGAFLNIGGIANITLLPAGHDPEAIRAWDTGPGMMISDALYRRAFEGPFDRNGAVAAGGQVSEAWLAAVLAHPFFEQAPPRSAGRETFGDAFVDEWLRHPAAAALSPADRIRCSIALTARTAAAALAYQPPGTLLLGGGGAHHPTLRADLAAALPGWNVAPSADVGWPVDAVEAAAFAILAYERVHDRPGNLPAVTGAKRALRLGTLAWPD
jgi:anhydro-N-acetylmuramic acid kinase